MQWNKRLASLALMAVVAGSVWAAKVNYVVAGYGLKAYNGLMFKIRPMAMEEVPNLDSARVVNGRLTLRGTVDGPTLCTIYCADPKLNLRANIVLGDDSRTVVSASKGSLLVRGGSRQALFATYEQELAASGVPSREALNKKYAEYSDEKTTATRREALEKEIESDQQKQLSFDKNFVLAHCDNVVGAYYFARNYIYFSKEELQKLRSRMTDEFAMSPLAARPLESLKAAERREPGQKFTDFEMPDTTGTVRRLSDYVGQGKYTLVDFWGSWCGPCRAEMPNVRALYEKYHAMGFNVVGVSLDNRRESWLKAIHDMQLPWPQLSDLKAWNCAAANLYGISGIPCTLLIGPDGIIIAQNLRGEDLAARLSALFDKAE